MKNKNTFYVTTPIYYVTAAPHLGSLYSTLLADVAARYHKLLGQEVFFLTGTDEHGQKVAQAAAKAGKGPKEFVDGFIDVYKSTWKKYEIEYSKFIRTTDSYHVKAVQDWIVKLIKQGDIYKGAYTGWYCTPCETFVTESKAAESDGQEIACSMCMRATTQISEECYYFRLSAYQDKLLTFLEQHPDFITPKERAREVISFIKEGLKDLSISRTTVTWGIPFPGDSKHVTYVWADALNNYITGVGYGTSEKEFNHWWPADLQILGKDIIRFHAIYWPAFLMASGLEIPHKLLVHGWIKMGDQKMSKSLGNAIDPNYLAEKYGVDEIRYYLTRKMAITQDSQFSIEDIEQSINCELADALGNLLNRMSTLAQKYEYTTVQLAAQANAATQKLQQQAEMMIKDAFALVEQGYFYRAVNLVWEFIGHVNAYFHAAEPWKQATSDRAAFQETIAATVHSLKIISLMLWPVMPKKMELMLESIGCERVITDQFERQHALEFLLNMPFRRPGERRDPSSLQETLTIKKIDTLFKKQEKIMEKPETQVAPAAVAEPVVNHISIDDFVKVELRVGTIVACDIVEKSDKLLKLQVDFGSFGKRQIFSGMRKHFKPEDIVSKQAVFVVNFKPRMMMGEPSEGMMLTSEGSLVTVSGNVENGSLVR